MVRLAVRLAAVLVLGGVAAPPPPAAAQAVTVQVDGADRRWTHRSWTVDDGLPQNSVTALLQTHDGYLWVGTFGGLARFDGVAFEVVPTVSSRVLALAEGPDGALWVGTEYAGVTRHHQGETTTYTVDDGLPSDLVFDLDADAGGRVWVATADGAAWVDDGRVGAVDDGRFAYDVEADDRGGAWFALGADSVLHVAVDGRTTWVGQEPAGPAARVTAVTQDPAGVLWAAAEGYLLRHDGQRLVEVPETRGRWATVRRMTTGPDGGTWLVGEHGLGYFDDDGYTHILAPNAPRETFRAVWVDREGSVWAGTNRRGLLRLRPATIQHFGQEQGLDGAAVYAVVEAADGTLWTAGCGGVARLTPGASTFAPWSAVALDACPRALDADADGTVWIGAARLVRWRDGRATLYALPGDRTVLATLADRAGRRWVGTNRGVYRLDGDALVPVPSLARLADERIQRIYEAPDGTLWFGTPDGLYRWRVGDPAPAEAAALTGRHVRDLVATGDGTLWVATYGQGLVRLRDGRGDAVTRAQGLRDDFLSRILTAADGSFWINGNRGIFRVRPDELNAVADGREARLYAQAFDGADGLIAPEGNGGAQYAGWRTRSGVLWFPNISGVARLDPERLTQPQPPPPVDIQRIVVDREERPRQDSVVIAPGDPAVEIRYTGLSFAQAERLRFRYRLRGYDPGWVEAGTRRTAYYAQLPPGDYTFEVQVAAGPGEWGPDAASAHLTVQPAMWQTPWFRLGLAAVLLALVGGAFYARSRWYQRQRAVLEARVAERTTALEQAHRHLADFSASMQLLSNIQSDIITRHAPDGTYLYVSPAAQLLLGLDPDAVIGCRPLDLCHPDDEDAIRHHYVQLMREEGVHTLRWRLHHAAGHYRWFETLSTSIRDPRTGRVKELVTVSRDITDQLDYERRLLEAKQQAEEMNRLRSHFLANMSHEIRTPLTSVIGFAELLGEEVGHEHQTLVQHIERNGKRLLDTLNSVLDLSMLEAGTFSLHQEAVDLGVEAADAVQLLQVQAQQKGLALRLELPSDEPVYARADRTAVHRVLTNLLANGIKFTREGEVAVRVYADGERAVMEVRDTGIGIHPDFVSQLFDEFKQESTGLARSFEGCGLGLSITQRLMELMNGSIDVESEPGAGSCFTVAFDRLPDHAAVAPIGHTTP